MAFLAVATLAYVVPGPDFLVVLRASATGRRAGLAAAAGAQAGLCLHVLAAACGLSLLLAHAPGALTAVRLAGAAYLCYLGVRAIRDARTAGSLDRPARSPFVQGLATNVLNPKAVLFFAAVLPQFLDPYSPRRGRSSCSARPTSPSVPSCGRCSWCSRHRWPARSRGPAWPGCGTAPPVPRSSGSARHWPPPGSREPASGPGRVDGVGGVAGVQIAAGIRGPTGRVPILPDLLGVAGRDLGLVAPGIEVFGGLGVVQRCARPVLPFVCRHAGGYPNRRCSPVAVAHPSAQLSIGRGRASSTADRVPGAHGRGSTCAAGLDARGRAAGRRRPTVGAHAQHHGRPAAGDRRRRARRACSACAAPRRAPPAAGTTCRSSTRGSRGPASTCRGR